MQNPIKISNPFLPEFERTKIYLYKKQHYNNNFMKGLPSNYRLKGKKKNILQFKLRQ
jgi:hypothetical protein